MPTKFVLKLWWWSLCAIISFAGILNADMETPQTEKLERHVLASLSKNVFEGLLDQKKSSRDLTFDWIQSLAFKRQGPEWYCLTEAIYFEARSESIMGQVAVAEVILNRIDSPVYPDTICEVVNQGIGEKHRCQFSYTCDGLREDIDDTRAFELAGKVASYMINGKTHNITWGATHYHSRYVSPSWSSKFYQTEIIGNHHFYRVNRQLSMK
ncbi:MAG: cell wall hydrolase [Roseovarius sp.]|nr:cell wall hydrolase [Roseovarius sp.]